MKLFRRVMVLIAVIFVAILVLLKFSDLRIAEIGRSFLATNLPAIFGGLKKLPDRPLAERLAEKGYTLGQPLLIRIFKEENTLEVWIEKSGQFDLALSYPICAWSGELGPKIKEGDRQSPEGYYFISERNLNPNSKYHRAINVGFPNAYDQALNRTGSALMIHGSCLSAGCYAITDAPMEDLYNAVLGAQANGQTSIPIHIYPFRLTNENLARHSNNRWAEFWRNLAEGDYIFSTTKRAPEVEVCGDRYSFGAEINNCTKVTSW
jgi:murein L,D-transpeptidase YafK